MSLRKTLLLAVFLGLALAYIFQVELPSDSKKLKDAELFAALPREQISSISITDQTGNSFSLNNSIVSQAKDSAEQSVRADFWKQWIFNGKQGTQIDRSALNALLVALASFKLEEPLPKEDVGTDLMPFGLDKPELILAVAGQQKNVELHFGKENSYTHKRYMKVVGDDSIFLLPTGLFAAAAKNSSEFRNKAPVEFVDGDLKELSIVDASGVLTQFRSTDQFVWKITQPASFAASGSALTELGRELRGMRVSEYIDAPVEQGKYGLDKPEAQVKLVFREGIASDPIEIKIGRPKTKKDEIYAMVSGLSSVFKLERDPLAKIVRPLVDFREKQLFKFATDQAVQLDFALYQAAPVSLMRQQDNWLVNGKAADTAFVNELLSSLAELKAESFPNDNRDYGFSNPRLKVVVRLKSIGPNEKPVDKVLLVGDSAGVGGNSEAQYYAVADDNRAEPFIISRDSFKKIFPREDILLKTEAPAPSGATPK
jgi:hypothetical protein